MQFPYNPLTMRILSNTPPTSIASPAIQSQQQQQPPPTATPVGQQRVWQSLLSEQYETLSDSDDWALLFTPSITRRGLRLCLFTPWSCSLMSVTSKVGWFALFWCYWAPWLLPKSNLQPKRQGPPERDSSWSRGTHLACRATEAEGTIWAIVKMKYLMCKNKHESLFLNYVWFL